MVGKRNQITVNGRSIVVSNLDTVLFPGYKFTKAHVIYYYIRISKYLLPHLRNRPVTLKRFPNGVFGEFFYEKDAPAFTPEWVKTFPVPRRETAGPDIRYVVVNDLPTLVWLANLAALELHPFLHHIPRINRPTSIVFDCDPGEGATLLDCARVALLLRAKLEELGLESLPKVSGSKGLQVCVPLNTPVTYQVTQAFAKSIAELLTRQEPALIVADMSKALRRKKVFIDWSQNSDYKTTVGVYSLRAKSYKPLVSMPVTWDELRTALDDRDVSPLYFNPQDALARADKLGDLFQPVLSMKQKLPAEIGKAFKVKSASRPARPASNTKRSTTAVRRSRQGSLRRFVIQQKSDHSYNVRLEAGTALKSWTLAGLPRTRKAQTATEIREASLDLLNSQKRSRTALRIWDAGLYQLIEGNMNGDAFRVYLNGEKMEADWGFARRAGRAKQWTVEELTSKRRK